MANKFQPVSWDAEEYLVKEHNAWWYVGLAVITSLFSILAIFIKGWTFLALIILSAITILVLNLRPPRKIHYKLDEKGLTEGKTLHPYTDYKAFGILKEGTNYAAVLIPAKRFGINVKVYFPQGSGEAIVDALGSRLPMEEVKQDFLDKIVNFLRI